MARDIYISVDIEADGAIPGPYSMLAFGLVVAADFDGRAFTPRDPRRVQILDHEVNRAVLVELAPSRAS